MGSILVDGVLVHQAYFLTQLPMHKRMGLRNWKKQVFCISCSIYLQMQHLQIVSTGGIKKINVNGIKLKTVNLPTIHNLQ